MSNECNLPVGLRALVARVDFDLISWLRLQPLSRCQFLMACSYNQSGKTFLREYSLVPTTSISV